MLKMYNQLNKKVSMEKFFKKKKKKKKKKKIELKKKNI